MREKRANAHLWILEIIESIDLILHASLHGLHAAREPGVEPVVHSVGSLVPSNYKKKKQYNC